MTNGSNRWILSQPDQARKAKPLPGGLKLCLRLPVIASPVMVQFY